jgi:hypothetical protein
LTEITKEWNWIEKELISNVDKKARKDDVFPQLYKNCSAKWMQEAEKDGSSTRKVTADEPAAAPKNTELSKEESQLITFQKTFNLANENLVAGEVAFCKYANDIQSLLVHCGISRYLPLEVCMRLRTIYASPLRSSII